MQKLFRIVVVAVAVITASGLNTAKAQESWKFIDPAYVSEPVEINGNLWLLPKETYYAHSTESQNGESRFYAVQPLPSNEDLGYCGKGQRDCPPHLMVVRIQVEEKNVSCISAVMDISWRVHFTSKCAVPVEIKFSVHFNPQRSPEELAKDYSTAASGGKLGLFFAVTRPEMQQAQLAVEEHLYDLGYSCWDCIAGTYGPQGEAIPLDQITSTEGPNVTPLGANDVPGIVFPISIEEKDFQFDSSILLPAAPSSGEMVTTVWLGQYNPAE